MEVVKSTQKRLIKSIFSEMILNEKVKITWTLANS